MKTFAKKKIIYGCEGRGDGDSPYLTRWTLLETKWGRLYLHQFHRGDADDLHDHPWNFWSVPIWPGYLEVTPGRTIRRWPLFPAFRPATWRHRVQLYKKPCPRCYGLISCGLSMEEICPVCARARWIDRACWTLVWAGPYVRTWGFFTAKGWQDFRSYFTDNGC